MRSRSATLIVYGVRCPSARARVRCRDDPGRGLRAAESADPAGDATGDATGDRRAVMKPLRRSVASTPIRTTPPARGSRSLQRRLLRGYEQAKADERDGGARRVAPYDQVLTDA